MTPRGATLAADEAMGGHTLARHVGRTDAQLAERLQKETTSARSWRGWVRRGVRRRAKR
jgi:Bacterial CdiA-CT RNAse A domain